eukprot:c4296_g1_i1.p1 GENE.c4296_g1_i1~~c4296_g1_i1.p1  ORF type:complete len:194 (-),score=61.52 c4296_g1_i1:58-639(-)
MSFTWFSKPKPIVVAVAWPGRRYQFEVLPTITVKELKQLIHEITGIPTEVQEFTYMNKNMIDKETLKFHNVQHDRTILLTRVKGVNYFICTEDEPKHPRTNVSKKTTLLTQNTVLDLIAYPDFLMEPEKYKNENKENQSVLENPTTKKENQPTAAAHQSLKGGELDAFLDEWFGISSASSSSTQQSLEQAAED